VSGAFGGGCCGGRTHAHMYRYTSGPT
jgi:hypothetical protein